MSSSDRVRESKQRPARQRRAAQEDQPVDTSAVVHSIAANLTAPLEFDGMASRLLEVGRRNFVKHGFHKSSVASIAEQAGASVGLLYYHFRNKEGLYRAVWTDYQRRQWQRAHQAIVLVRSAGIEDGRVLFLAGTRAYLANCWENRDVVRMVADGDVPPGFSAESRAATDEWLRMNARLLRMPDNRSTQVLVGMASAAIGGAARVIAECETRADADEVVEFVMQIFSHMIAFATGEGDVEAFTRTSSMLP